MLMDEKDINKPIAFVSHTLNQMQRTRVTIEREALHSLGWLTKI